ncbi:site-specific integrase [Nonomuraea sp. WAC 01424]|uniref:site-specific integrase n=1 Tax=Nonomuraea sp. WAC 01424 TaxID=2203200 RepID=UPI000F7976EE|nr:site-specific integrase [Nonomuraea sp. WAC 01424]RSM93958.1 site-specific integrase [Nonomuraea sp. WAC 01424]
MPTKTALASPEEPKRPRTSRRTRANNEGSIFPYKNGWAGYVWVTTPEGNKTRKWAYGKTREETHEKWLKLHEQARRGPVATKHETVTAFLTLCACCDQRKDHKRPEHKRRCCSIGKCCKGYLSRSSIAGIRRVLRSVLGHALREELVTRNVASLTTLPSASKTKKKRQNTVWTVDEARRFLEHLREVEDPLYAAYVLILVLGLRRGEVLGLTWDSVDLVGEQLWISHQLTRVGGRLLHRHTTKTEDSTASLPLFGLCVSALRHRQRVQEEARKMAGDAWTTSDMMFTTRTGTPIEPRNFNRAFETHCRRAGVPRIRVHNTRHTCASLLAALDVHPRVAMRILRHSQISMTMDVYTQIPSPETRKALDRLNKSLTTDQNA